MNMQGLIEAGHLTTMPPYTTRQISCAWISWAKSEGAEDISTAVEMAEEEISSQAVLADLYALAEEMEEMEDGDQAEFDAVF